MDQESQTRAILQRLWCFLSPPSSFWQMTGWFTIMAMLFITCCTALTDIQRPHHVPTLFVDAIARRTVTLVSTRANSEARYPARCGGVYIEEHIIATAWHCVDGAPVWCTTDDGKNVYGCDPKSDDHSTKVIYFRTYEDYRMTANRPAPWVATIQAVNMESDLALLYTTHGSTEIAVMPMTDPHPDEAVHVIGHPAGKVYSYTETRVKRIRNVIRRKWNVPMRQVVVDYDPMPGTSGAGLWNARGQLVGISLAHRSALDEGYFAAASEVRDLMINMHAGTDVPGHW